ncbi:MAG TPA: nuclear transport factor 2 family protein [Rhizomicrobium sp.]|nr:nuclear transport factor 2 family protein [Rhizomicrobium sp.]
MRTLAFVLAVTAALPALAGPKDDLLAADKAFSAMSAAEGSNAAFLAYLADDGRLYGTGNEAPIFGKAEAAKRFQTGGNGDPKTNVLSWSPNHAEVSGDGGLGYTDGDWRFDAASMHLSGHYVTVWRSIGGQWKVAADIATTDPKK